MRTGLWTRSPRNSILASLALGGCLIVPGPRTFGAEKPKKLAAPASPAAPAATAALPQAASLTTANSSASPGTPSVDAPRAASEPYPSIAVLAATAENTVPVTKNDWVLSRTTLADGTMILNQRQDPPPPDAPGTTGCTVEEYTDACSTGPFWSGPWGSMALPPRLLWTVPLANQREPRMYAKFTNLHGESTIDTAIGGQFGLARFYPTCLPNEGFQIDGFAAVFSRFDGARRLAVADYRAGVPLTYAKGPWQAKLSYEHTSSHLGDDLFSGTGIHKREISREEIVVGIARRWWDQVRAYGQLGYSFAQKNPFSDNRDRYDMGLEWSRSQATTGRGQPFAAADFEVRGDQDYAGSLTLQAGWQWQNGNLWGARLALEYYNGRSPYGQLQFAREEWIGFAALYDW